MGEQEEGLQEFAEAMKRDWDDRARENAKWYINTLKMDQSDEEFDSTGWPEVERLVLNDPVLTRGRDFKRLRLLEIGCGIGRLTKHLAGVFGEVHATDVSGEMIKRGRERLRDHPNVFMLETNGVDFAAFPAEYFDMIFSVYVFQHVPDISVIHSNIRDACRVLKPGGLFKFQVSGVDQEAYAEIPKDTWSGTAFSDTEIRRAARESGVKLISILGYGTQYCFVILRKPRQPRSSRTAESPVIECVGRSDNPQIKAIPTNGDNAYLTLVVSGLDQNEADANSIVVEIEDRDYAPLQVSSVDDRFAEAVGGEADQLIQINLSVTPQMPRGRAGVRVKSGEVNSERVTIEFLEPQSVVPRINLISNTVDGGVDVYARGERAVFRTFASGLDHTATPENVRVHVNQHILKPLSVTFIPASGMHMAVAQMPEDMSAGEAEIRLQFGDLISLSAMKQILE